MVFTLMARLVATDAFTVVRHQAKKELYPECTGNKAPIRSGRMQVIAGGIHGSPIASKSERDSSSKFQSGKPQLTENDKYVRHRRLHWA
jgi:hypothetical protein